MPVRRPNCAKQCVGVIGGQIVGLVKLDLTVAGLVEYAVEHDDVVMRVDIEGRAEAMGRPRQSPPAPHFQDRAPSGRP